MTDYRRNFIAGGTFFFTVNLRNRRLKRKRRSAPTFSWRL
jgi:hypothetical protein